jgi:NRAMP (natural resistance-associated macrophage protein)-like metal ion transporter
MTRARYLRNRLFFILAILGPGFITANVDNDAGGILTYSQAGAQFGYSLAWVMVFTFPLMAAIQEISARIGRVTGHGIAGNIRAHYPRWLLYTIVALLLVANIINLGADLGAMAAAVQLVIGGPLGIYIAGFAVFCAWLQIEAKYARYVQILKWTSFILLAYVVVALVVHVPWAHVAYRIFIPHLSLKSDYVITVVAVLGTTITPYCFFWQSSEEAEEERIDPAAHPLIEAPAEAPAQLARIRFDTYIGMAYSNVISLAIIVSTAATLNAHGVSNIATSAQAAEALRPIAGEFTFALFAAGIIGIGLLAVPVLAGSGAYALGEAMGWRTGLDYKPYQARGFYITIAISTVVGALINFVGLDPIKALFYAAVINGVVAVPLMVVIMLMGARRDVMGDFTLPPILSTVGWACTVTMAIAVAVMVIGWQG